MILRHPAVLNPVENWHTYPMRGIEYKDGQLISEPSRSHVGFYNAVHSVTLYT